MNIQRTIPITSPQGVWDYYQLLGATVKISSLSVAGGMFGYDSDQEYQIEDIGMRVNKDGKMVTSIRLKGVKRDFVWKDLDLTKVQFNLWKPAITGIPCCGYAKCGYKSDLATDSCNCNCNGAILDPGILNKPQEDQDKPITDKCCCENEGTLLD